MLFLLNVRQIQSLQKNVTRYMSNGHNYNYLCYKANNHGILLVLFTRQELYMCFII